MFVAIYVVKNEYKYIYLYILDNNIIQRNLISSNKNDIWNLCEGIRKINNVIGTIKIEYF